MKSYEKVMKSYQKLSRVIKKLSKLISMMQDILATTDTERFVVWKDKSRKGYWIQWPTRLTWSLNGIRKVLGELFCWQQLKLQATTKVRVGQSLSSAWRLSTRWCWRWLQLRLLCWTWGVLWQKHQKKKFQPNHKLLPQEATVKRKFLKQTQKLEDTKATAPATDSEPKKRKSGKTKEELEPSAKKAKWVTKSYGGEKKRTVWVNGWETHFTASEKTISEKDNSWKG